MLHHILHENDIVTPLNNVFHYKMQHGGLLFFKRDADPSVWTKMFAPVERFIHATNAPFAESNLSYIKHNLLYDRPIFARWR